MTLESKKKLRFKHSDGGRNPLVKDKIDKVERYTYRADRMGIKSMLEL